MANKKITQLDAVQEALGTDWLPVGREGSNQGTKVSIEQIEEYVELTIKENASAGTSDDDLATIGYVNDALADAGGGTIELETEINSVNPSNLKVPTSKAVADYVSAAVADAGGGSIELETEINSVNPSNLKAPTSKAVADYVSEGLSDKVNTNQIGVANGVAPLGADGKVPTANLPSILSNDSMQDPGGGTPGQILEKTEDGYKWADKTDAAGLTAQAVTPTEGAATIAVVGGKFYTVSDTVSTLTLTHATPSLNETLILFTTAEIGAISVNLPANAMQAPNELHFAEDTTYLISVVNNIWTATELYVPSNE